MVQPTREARVGMAVMPREISGAASLLRDLQETAPRALRGKRVLLTWGMRDRVYPARRFIRKFTDTFDSCVVEELSDVGLFFQEEAPDRVADAIIREFGRV